MTKDASQFSKRTASKDGLQRWCKACVSASHKESYAAGPRKTSVRSWKDAGIRRNVEYVQGYLETHPCVDCGESDTVVLDFDHVRGEKSGGISQMVYHALSLEAIRAEIAKCDVRCANDHRRVTHARRIAAKDVPI